MKSLQLNIPYQSCSFDELPDADRKLVESAKAACATSYAPYSAFSVGAAVALQNGEIVCGSNQENAAYPSGTCAERCAMFYANARFPNVPPTTIAISACDAEGHFTATPITPCGACRQVLIETQKRYGQPLRVLLYGERHTLCLDSISLLLPFQFDADAM